MQSEIRDVALELGYLDAKPATGHPFDVWRKRLSSIPLGQHLSFAHDPVAVSGWPLEEITIWAAVSATPPIEGWPDDCGEIGAYYMRSEERSNRYKAWKEKVVELGYEIASDFTLPDRAAAIRAGLGVHGLNGLLITPGYGSFVGINLLLIRAAPPPDARGPEFDMSPGCGDCGICIPTCPSGAITENGVDTVICLRTYMNWPEYMPEEDYSKMDKRIVGCDICQHVCPKNALLKWEQPPTAVIECMKLEKLLTDPGIDDMFNITKLKHTSTKDVKRQAIFATANTGRKDLLPLILPLADSDDEWLRKAARWAIRQLQSVSEG